ncbi:MAG: peptidylprolyl isomerase [Alphaproteobacteria bacterium]|nr:peptidylprolyl isomerase [Alphaproteobacteria bacterium]
MKKIFVIALLTFLCIRPAFATDVNLQQLDSDSRTSRPSSNSIMFRRNAEQYRQLSDEEKQEIERQREVARQQAEVYRKKQEEYMRRQAQIEAERRAQEEMERQRAEALRPITLYENKLKIYALVNGELITSSDMQSRINAFILTTGIPYNGKTKTMITNKVLQSAIDEKLKIQAAKKSKIKVSAAEIKQAIRNFETSNNLPEGGLQQILSNAKVSMTAWIKQIEADLAWKKYVVEKSYGRVNVGESEINRALEEYKKDIKVQKFMVSELVRHKNDAKDINGLAAALHQDPRFELYAMQFSQSPTSANGGRLGWVAKGRLPAPLEQAVLKLKPGQVSNPILYGNNYYILKLEQVYDPNSGKQTMPSRKEIQVFLQNKKMEELSEKYMKDLRSRALIEKKI